MPSELDELLAQTDSDAWNQLIAQGDAQAAEASSVDVELYAVVFGSDAGRQVLADLHARYVNVSRNIPGQPEGSGFYREGMAQVVFDIVARIGAAERGDETYKGK